jgi:hypothetical protein
MLLLSYFRRIRLAVLCLDFILQFSKRAINIHFVILVFTYTETFLLMTKKHQRSICIKLGYT